jgi:hypothetical protein
MSLRPYLALFSLVMAASANSQSVNLDFSGLGSSMLSFNGSAGTFGFNPDGGSGYDFEIGSSSLPSLVGLEGNISGTFTIGSISTFGSIQEATISGTGTFSIYDGSSSSLTGNITWATAATNANSNSTIGSLNTFDVSNISNLSYSGSNAALLELAGDATGVATVSFQFTGLDPLSQLANGGTPLSSSYSGSVSAIPEPSMSAVLMGVAAIAGVLVRRQAVRVRT